MIWAIEHPDELRTMGKKAKEAVQPWEKKKILKRYAEELYKVMDAPSHPL